MGALDGKTALVTGGSRGIGHAVSRRLGRDGALVIVHYGHNERAARKTVAELEADGATAVAVKAVLGEDGDVDTLFAALDAELERLTGSTHLDVVVNNAGIVRGEDLERTTLEDFELLMAVNVRAPLFINQAAVTRMSAGGRLIATSSAVTHKAWPDQLAYSMSKGAIDVMTRTLAKGLAPRGVTVNAVLSGLVDTELTDWQHSSPEMEELTAAFSPFNRVGQPRDIADIVAFLASEDSRWITGQLIDASGGTNL